jgi:protein O-GlcNAc transferase
MLADTDQSLGLIRLSEGGARARRGVNDLTHKRGSCAAVLVPVVVVSTQLEPEASGEAEQARAWLALGAAELDQGRPARALEWLTRAERAAPRSADVLVHLGVAQRQSGLTAQAIQSYERALAVDDAQANVWVNLARARREAKQLDAALAAFERALTLDPAARTWSMASNLLRELGRYDAAIQAARTAIERDPRLGEAHLNEGSALHLSGRLDAAVVSYLLAARSPETRERALRNLSLALEQAHAAGAPSPALAAARDTCTSPGSADAWFVLSRIERGRERPLPALLCLEQALEYRPDASGYRELGALLWEAGLHADAEQALVRAATLDPSDVATYRLYGSWFVSGERRPGSAWPGFTETCPDDPVALTRLGSMAQRLGHPVTAQRLYERVATLRPNSVESHLYLGTVLTEQGKPDEAILAFERALALDASRWDVSSSLLFCLHLQPDQDAGTLLERHRTFGERLRASLPRPALPPDGSGARERLRIGYVSPDLCAHPVQYFLEPVLIEHDRSRFDIICYSDVKRPDAVTERLARLCTLVPVSGWSHERLAERIRSDRVDILVDLAGHTSNNRLPTFARRPSPVQASWLGYFATTGLEAIDYRIADRVSVPPRAERLFVERVVMLPRSANCYAPPEAPPPAAPPCLVNGHVTFGCFNNPMKIGRDVCALFARVLGSIEHSQLLLKYRTWSDPALVRRHREWFAEEGVAPERLDFEGSSAMPEFLAAFSRIDVALDPFPYSGETTALHTLWMGVPLVALEGQTLVQRLGSRVLRLCHLDGWVAATGDEYVAITTELASAPTRLAALRAELRQRLLASPLCDHRGVTRELEAAYQTMWRERALATLESPAL